MPDQDMRKAVAREIMATELITLHPDQPIVEAVDTLITNKISGAPVLDGEGTLVGVISEKDCLSLIVQESDNQPTGTLVKHFMSTNVMTIEADEDVITIAGRFLANPYRRLPVLEGGKLVGQVSRRDALKTIHEARKEVTRRMQKQERGSVTHPDSYEPPDLSSG